MSGRIVKRAHTISKVYRSRKILIVDGDQNKVGRGQRDLLLSRYGEVHVFRNPVNADIQGRQEIEATWCKYHTSPTSEKEAVDHNITFFCGRHAGEWRRDNVSVTIVSKDKTFRNTQSLLETIDITCDILHEIPNPPRVPRPKHRGSKVSIHGMEKIDK
jgi:hypothetical protein